VIGWEEYDSLRGNMRGDNVALWLLRFSSCFNCGSSATDDICHCRHQHIFSDIEVTCYVLVLVNPTHLKIGTSGTSACVSSCFQLYMATQCLKLISALSSCSRAGCIKRRDNGLIYSIKGF
jgi:hypothetical protein